MKVSDIRDSQDWVSIDEREQSYDDCKEKESTLWVAGLCF